MEKFYRVLFRMCGTFPKLFIPDHSIFLNIILRQKAAFDDCKKAIFFQPNAISHIVRIAAQVLLFGFGAQVIDTIEKC